MNLASTVRGSNRSAFAARLGGKLTLISRAWKIAGESSAGAPCCGTDSKRSLRLVNLMSECGQPNSTSRAHLSCPVCIALRSAPFVVPNRCTDFGALDRLHQMGWTSIVRVVAARPVSVQVSRSKPLTNGPFL